MGSAKGRGRTRSASVGRAPFCRSRVGRPLVGLIALIFLASCADPNASVSEAPSPASVSDGPSASPTSDAVPSPIIETGARLVAAGDIASCDEEGDSATAALVATLGDDITVATLGDNVYPSGNEQTYASCYDPVWGPWLARTHPAIGNHDAETDAGTAYHAYFGDRAGPPDVAWYSYDIGAWHTVVLDSNCALIGCYAGSPQHRWLVADLAASTSVCTLAYWHHPRFSSGPHGDEPATGPFWEALQDAGADVILVGHDHLYERFAPQAPDGSAFDGGIRQFTVGTGGKELYESARIAPNSELIIDDSFGVLELTLHANSYAWRFLAVDGGVADAGTADCH